MASSSTAAGDGELENDDMFEGMVLFTSPTTPVVSDSSPSPCSSDVSNTSTATNRDDQVVKEDIIINNNNNKGDQTSKEEAPHPHPHAAADHDSLSLSSSSSPSAPTPPPPPPLPLDENLFADLSLIVETPQKEDYPVEDLPPPPSASSTTPTLRLLSLSRKKKRATGLRIGYGRDRDRDQDTPRASEQHLKDQDHDHLPFPVASTPIENYEHEQHPALAPASTSSHPQFQEEYEEEEEQALLKPTTTSATEIRLEEIRVRIAQKLDDARQAVFSVSASRKDSVRDRRKAVQLLSEASAKYWELEKELQEACEAEDFEKAERVSDSLASADKDKEILLLALRDAEARCDALDSKMQEALDCQIQAEEECASLLQRFALDASNNADSVLDNAEAVFLGEMEKWLSSTEEVELKRLQLDIESHFINEARSALHNFVVHSTEDDHRERDILYKRRENLTEELQKLLSLVKEKEAEIAENNCRIETVEKSIAGVVSNFEEVHSGLDAKHNNLQLGLKQLDLEYELLSKRKKQIDDDHCQEEARGAKISEISRISADEANTCEEVVGLRKSLMQFILKFMENKVRLSKTEQQLTEDVNVLRLGISVTRASLQELSSSKSSVQQEVESFTQRLFFIDKRVPELEAEKKVAATARNFKEAARIATEAKTLCVEREGLGIKMEDATLQLQKLEEQICNTVNRLEETESQVLLKEKELEMARFQRLTLVAEAATAERSAALELGDLEEADILSAEANAAAAEARKLQLLYNYNVEDFANQTKYFVPMELVSKLGVKQLAELVTSIDFSAC